MPSARLVAIDSSKPLSLRNSIAHVPKNLQTDLPLPLRMRGDGFRLQLSKDVVTFPYHFVELTTTQSEPLHLHQLL